ncbi:MAG: hypothetical protein LC118_12120 [Dehalococcoidia bacterium]|nr:hypothetical protein [Dehalococcoidia bacterium]
MPSDILFGTEVIEDDVSTGKRYVRFIRRCSPTLGRMTSRTPPRTAALAGDAESSPWAGSGIG